MVGTDGCSGRLVRCQREEIPDDDCRQPVKLHIHHCLICARENEVSGTQRHPTHKRRDEDHEPKHTGEESRANRNCQAQWLEGQLNGGKEDVEEEQVDFGGDCQFAQRN